MERAISRVFPLFSVSPHSNFSPREISSPQNPIEIRQHYFFNQGRPFSRQKCSFEDSSSTTSLLTCTGDQRELTAGLSNPPRKTQKLCPEFLPRRAGD